MASTNNCPWREYTICPVGEYRAKVAPSIRTPCSPVSRERTAMRDVSEEPVQIAKKAPFPPGRNSGHRWEDSPWFGSGVVTAEGAPPEAETRKSPEYGVGERRIVSSSPQLAPQALGASQSMTTVRVAAWTLFNELLPQKPIHSPSGKKAVPTFSVPGIAVASGRSMGRPYNFLGRPPA